ncbi:MAG: TOBE domain-containing protein [Pseudomonadota bacterium]
MTTIRSAKVMASIYVTHDQIEAMTLADRIVVMHGGHIQQQGTPEELFKHPANRFVAGFLGSPPMNFLDGEIVQRGEHTYIDGQGFSIELNPQRAASAKTHSAKTVTLGIRPSDLLYNPEAADSVSVDLNVVYSEYVGAQSVLLTKCGKQTVDVELKSETPIQLGETLRFAVNPAGIHLFDRQSEHAL